MKKLEKIKVKITIWLILIIITFGVVATSLAFVKYKNDFLSIKEEDLKLITQVQSAQVTQLINQSKGLSKGVATTESILNFLNDKTPDNYERLIKVLNGFNINEAYESIYIMNQEGITVAATDKTFEGNNYAFRNYFKKAIVGEENAEVAVGSTTKKPGYYFASPVYSPNGIDVMAVVVFKLKAEVIREIMISHNSLEDERVMLVNNYGIVVSTNKKDSLYKAIGNLTSGEISQIEKGRNFANIDFRQPYVFLDGYDNLEILLDDLKSEKSTQSYRDIKDGDRFFSVSKVSGFFPLFLVREVKIDMFSIVGMKNALLLSGVIIAAAVLALILLLFVVNKILSTIPSCLEDKHKHK